MSKTNSATNLDKNLDKIVSERKSELQTLQNITSELYNECRQAENAIRQKAEIIIVSWAFIFGAIATFYEAEVLNRDNNFQIVLLIFVMSISLLFSIIAGVRTEKKQQVDVEKLWEEYTRRVEKNNFNNIGLQESIIGSTIDIEKSARRQIQFKARMIWLSGLLIFLELLLIIVFVIFKQFSIMVVF